MITDKPTYGWDDSMGISLLAKLKADLKTSMLTKDNGVKDAIRIIMSEFPKLTVPLTLESGKKTTRPKKPEEITNDEIIDIIKGLTKSEKITLEFKKEASSEYLETLAKYLPQLVSSEELRDWIQGNINLADFKSPMQAMGTIMKHFGKRADGSMVKEILQSLAA